MRHGEATTSNANEKDADRALTRDGRARARETARVASERGWIPDVTLCSASRRSRETLEVMGEADAAFGAVGRTLYLGSLYHFASLDGQYRTHLAECVAREIGILAACPPEEAACAKVPDARTIMAVGHNKGMEEAATELCGEEVRLLQATAALLEREVDVDATWADVLSEGKGKWTLVAVATPDGLVANATNRRLDSE